MLFKVINPLSLFLFCMTIFTSEAIAQQEVVEPRLVDIPFINSSLQERDFAMSSSGDTILYTVGSPDQKVRGLFMLKKDNNQWQKPELLPFSGTFQDIEPFFDPSSNKVYFSSQRPMDEDSTRRDYNIWFVEAKQGNWTEPQALDETINTAADEFYPSLSNNGNLYFTSGRKEGIGLEDIYMSEFVGGSFTSPRLLDSTINTSKYEFNAYISPDEDLLIFTSYGRPDGQGGGDLYYSTKENGYWIEAKPLPLGVNGPFLDFCPFVDWQNDMFYFTSNRRPHHTIESYEWLQSFSSGLLNGHHNIYQIELRQILK